MEIDHNIPKRVIKPERKKNFKVKYNKMWELILNNSEERNPFYGH